MLGRSATLRLLGAPTIWFAHFSAVYGPKAFFCSRGLTDIYPAFIVAVTAAAVLALVVLILKPLRRPESSALFLDRASLALGLLSLCAVLWATLPAVFLPACAGPG